MESIEKLRELACDINGNEIIDHMQLYPSCVFDGHWLDSWHMEFDRALDAIEREIADKYMELPVDADGEPIHIGDAMYDGKVAKLVISDDGEHSVYVYKLPNVLHEFYCYETAHVKPDPIKKLLEEFAYKVCDLNVDSGECERYAAKIREAVSAE